MTPTEQKRPTEEISAPADELHRLFQRLLPQIRRVLVTQDAAFRFVIELYHQLPGVDGDVTDDGVIICRPPEGSEPMQPIQNVTTTPLQVVA